MSKLKTVAATVTASFIGVGLLAGCGTASQSTPAATSDESPSREAGFFSSPRPIKLVINNYTSKDLSFRQHIEPVGAVEAEIVSPDTPKPLPWQQGSKASSFDVIADERLGAPPLSVEIGDDKNLDRITLYNPRWNDPLADVAVKINGKLAKAVKVDAQRSDPADPTVKAASSWTSQATGNKYVLSFDDAPGKYMTLYLRVRK